MIQNETYENVIEKAQLKEEAQNLKSFDEIQNMLLQFGSNIIIPFQFFTVKGFVRDIEHYQMFYGENPFHYKAPITIEDAQQRTLQIIAFDEAGQKLFGTSATELKFMQQRENKKWIQKMQKVCKSQSSFLFMLQAKVNEYKGSKKIQLICQTVKKVEQDVNKTAEVKSSIITSSSTVDSKPDIASPKLKQQDAVIEKLKSLSTEPINLETKTVKKKSKKNKEILSIAIDDAEEETLETE